MQNLEIYRQYFLLNLVNLLNLFLSIYFNPLSANPTKWSNTLKQFVELKTMPTNSLSVIDRFVGLVLKGLNSYLKSHGDTIRASFLMAAF